MIAATLADSARYEALHPRFNEAFRFLQRRDLAELPDGRHEIVGTKLFAIVSREVGRGREASLLEHHRRYIDIQFVINGKDEIGWRPLQACTRVSQPYDEERDLGFFYDRPATWVEIQSGSFAIFFPEDAHAPLASDGPIQKVVLKVLAS